MLNEKELIAAVLDGDAESFSQLVRAHQARVRLSCLVFLGNKEEADDAAQDVFVKAYTNIASFRGEALFETWLLRIADNHCRDLLRARKGRRTESLEAFDEAALDRLLSRTASTEPEFAAHDLELLGRLFAALPQEDREVLALREVNMLSYEEIGRNLHCSLDAVKGRLKRARAALMEKCRNKVDTSDPTPRLKK